jgi:hypothetical protein
MFYLRLAPRRSKRSRKMLTGRSRSFWRRRKRKRALLPLAHEEKSRFFKAGKYEKKKKTENVVAVAVVAGLKDKVEVEEGEEEQDKGKAVLREYMTYIPHILFTLLQFVPLLQRRQQTQNVS